MADEGHRLTDEQLTALEKRISRVYGQAAKEMQDEVDAYFRAFAKRDAEQKRRLEAGEITEQQYKQWRLAQMGRGKRFAALRDRLAERMTKANEVAAAYVNDATPGIYSLNRNYAAYTIEQVSGDVGFTLWDEQTAKRLLTEQPDLMPYYPPARAIRRGIDLAYGKKQITAQVTSGILMGESIGKLADRLQRHIPEMNRTSAIRAARTAVTGAENAGRQDTFLSAEKMGLKLKKRWLATLDGRTRHAHALLDGQTAAPDKPFKVDGYELMFPGDKSAPAYLVYNCRCTVAADLDGVDTSDAKRWAVDPVTGESMLIRDMTYSQWAGWKESVAPSANSGIIKEKAADSGESLVRTIGKIDTEKYKCVTPGITTDEVIITDERIQHIRDRHPQDFERYSAYIRDLVENPQYILAANKPATAFILKEYAEAGERFQLILRLAVEGDAPEHKNSVITFLKVEEKRFKRYLRTKKILYKSE